MGGEERKGKERGGRIGPPSDENPAYATETDPLLALKFLQIEFGHRPLYSMHS